MLQREEELVEVIGSWQRDEHDDALGRELHQLWPWRRHGRWRGVLGMVGRRLEDMNGGGEQGERIRSSQGVGGVGQWARGRP